MNTLNSSVAPGTTLGLAFALGGAFCNSGSMIQTRRLTQTGYLGPNENEEESLPPVAPIQSWGPPSSTARS